MLLAETIISCKKTYTALSLKFIKFMATRMRFFFKVLTIHHSHWLFTKQTNKKKD